MWRQSAGHLGDPFLTYRFCGAFHKPGAAVYCAAWVCETVHTQIGVRAWARIRVVWADFLSSWILKWASPNFFVAQKPSSVLGRLFLRRLDHAQWHTHTHIPLNEWSARRRGRYLHDTQQTNIHALSVIRTRDPSSQAASDLRLRPQGHRDRHSPTYLP
jgi:hypothetical protein